jgi:hypothetical protein
MGLSYTSLIHFDDQLTAGLSDLHRNGSAHVLEAIICVVLVVVMEMP